MRYPSIDELRVRGAQKINSLTERLAWSSQLKVPSIYSILAPELKAKIDSHEALLERFRSRTQPKFFPSFADEKQTIGLFRAECPNEAQSIVASADEVLNGRFNLLGFRGLSFGDEIDWHFEAITGKRIPLIHWSRLDYLDASVAGDKKIVWELNRQQYFITLGQAYLLTGDEKYAQGFVGHIESWMNQNPPKLGINWASSLEVAFRSISWIWALYYFRKSPTLSAKTFSRILTFLYLNARHIESYLSTYFSPNTHLTGEALGLFYLGTLFPELKDASRWKKKGNEILLAELSRHVRPDGVYFEQSSYYHRYTVEFYTHYLILLQENGNIVPGIVRAALSSMLDHLMYITRPDGKTPLFGDDDGGRLVKLDLRDPNDFRSTLATAAVLFQRPDYKYVANGASEAIFWLLGSKGIETFSAMSAEEPKESSKAFPHGGYYVLRDGWSSTASYLLFDCGPHGSLSSGHSHADALGFELASNGQAQIVDPGTYTYTGSREWRDWFRSSAAHNTLTLDSESSSVPAGPFSWKTKAHCEALKWISDRRFDYIQARHDGYLRLPHPAEHTRSILFIKNDYWFVRDNISSTGAHKAELWFHLAPGLDPTIDPDGSIVAVKDGRASLELAVFGVDGCWRQEPGWVSRCYGEKEPAQICVYSANTTGDQEMLTFLLPQRAAAGRLSIKPESAKRGKAFHISGDDRFDVVMIGSGDGGEEVETGKLTSDAAWTWVRFSGIDQESVLEEFILLSGRKLDLNGKTLFETTKKVDYVVGRRINGQLLVEISESKSPVAV